MFAPMIIIREEGAMAALVARTAGDLGVPVIENCMLAGNLFAYGKLGEPIPDLCYRETAAVMSRLTPRRLRRKVPAFKREGRSLQVKVPRPLSIELGEVLWTFLDEGEDDKKSLLAEPLNRIRTRLCRLLGFSLPRIKVLKSSRLKAGEYRILFKGVEAGRDNLELGWYKGRQGAAPAFGEWPSFGGLEFSPSQLHSAAKAGAAYIIRHVDEIALRRASDFLGRDEVQFILDGAEKKYPVVTSEVKNLLSLGCIRDVFRSLVEEQVSIRHIAVILETLADWGSFGPSPNEVVVEQIRQSLKRQICLEYADDRRVLKVLTLQSDLEQTFADRAIARESGREENSGGLWDEWLEALSPAVRGMEERGLRPIILCSPMARSWVREITRKKFPNLAVLSYVEIPPDINVEPVGEIKFEPPRGSSPPEDGAF
jgi:flagellar biosynthesis protein FlhA